MLIKYILTQKQILFKHFCVLNDNVFHILFLIKQIGESVMKRVWMLCVAIIIVCLLSGCVGRGQNTVYISGEIECEVSWVIENTAYRAFIERKEDFTRIWFAEPRSLGGIELVRDGEDMSATLDDMKITDGIEGLFEIEKFFEYDTVILSSDFDGGVEYLELERADGEKFGLVIEDGIPVRIEGELYGKPCEIKLISIEGDMLGG